VVASKNRSRSEQYGRVELGQPRQCRNRVKRIVCVVALVVLVAACSSSHHLSTPRSTTTFTPTTKSVPTFPPKPESRVSTRGPQLPVPLSLVNQTTWDPLRQTLTMKLHIDDPALAERPGAAIAIRIRQSTTSRSGFDQAIASRNLGRIIYVPNQISVASLHPDAHRDVSIEFGLHGSGIRPIVINHPGIYPVEVQLVNVGAPSASFVTALVTT
jgi:hypothetical protein